MDDDQLAAVERRAVDIAWDAGCMLLSRFRQPLKVDWKGKREGDDPVTDADNEVETFVRDELARHFPSHALVGEEGAGSGSEPKAYTWVVDPLDGTTNFLNGLPAFACSIALLERGVPVVAAIFVPWPATDGALVLHARCGGGSWAGDQALRLPKEPPPPGGLIVLPRGPYRLSASLSHRLANRRSVGSIAYELAATALRTYRFVLFSSPRVWDVAAGALLVKEAGGAVMTLPEGGGPWQPLAAFAAPERSSADGAEAGMPGQEELRSWSRPLLAGPAPAVEKAAAGIVPYHPLLPRAFRMVRRALRPRTQPKKETGPV
ncbi:MAG: inositol monophosphatase [Dehalococcoidia bacterium]